MHPSPPHGRDEKGERRDGKEPEIRYPGCVASLLCASVPVVRACVACGLGWQTNRKALTVFDPKLLAGGGGGTTYGGTEGGEGRWCGTRRNCKFSGGVGLVVVIESRLNGLCRLPGLPATACA